MPVAARSLVFGVLNAQPKYMKMDAAAGVHLAMINIGWDNWEPEPGRMNSSYIDQQLAIIHQYENAGWTVAVDLGLEFPPSWAIVNQSDQLADQNGNRSGTPNFEFSGSVRQAASEFIQNAVKTLPGISYYRIGLSQFGEMLYPASPRNEWWAFDAYAQGSQVGLPTGMSPSPMPGWIPGQSEWRGTPVSQAMVERWYDWYVGALVNAHNWEITTIRASGYAGDLQYVIPGTGVLPDFYQAELANRLSPVSWDPFHTMNTGSVWWRVLQELPSSNAVIDISSVGDGSGSVGAKECQESDPSTNYMTDRKIETWSDTRWLTYLARQHGLGVIGENAGSTDQESLPAIMSMVQSCGLTALQWAWDAPLNEGTGLISLGTYGKTISASARN
jgi:hypothetical protein